MDTIPNHIIQIINNYLIELKKNQIPIQQAILFGSYAKGNYHKNSDIDIALVSEIFHGDRILDKNKIRRVTLKVSYDLQVFPYNPKDFNRHNPFINDIIQTGKRLI